MSTSTVKGTEAGKYVQNHSFLFSLNYDILLWRSPGYGMTLVSESTSGVMHSAESSIQATPTQPPGHGEREDGDEKLAHILPEIGKQMAMYLIEEN